MNKRELTTAEVIRLQNSLSRGESKVIKTNQKSAKRVSGEYIIIEYTMRNYKGVEFQINLENCISNPEIKAKYILIQGECK